MTTTTSRWISATLAAAGIGIGILAGTGAPSTPQTHNMADYGAAITADDATDHARDRGVPHMDDHEHAPGYFERMDGVGR
ncbi:MAG: hypothetical protein U0R66_10795 [Mycobacterium sp.]